MLSQLVHNGIIVPDPPSPRGLVVRVRGEMRRLTPKEEEMVMAFASKKDTDYVQDAVFVTNYMRDLSAEMGISPPLAHDELDWDPAHRIVDAERRARENLSPEERKAAARSRKLDRDALKARYGFAIVDGRRVELGNYMVEPSGIFMGRGQHPLRGRWKEGATQADVTLNLSNDAPRVAGNWQAIVWQPESLWVARWKDKLADRLKYIWLSDTAPAKQEREEGKFDKALRLDAELERVRASISADLQHERPERRRIATACYLIDALCLRVGDEKDPDEADTVGATTLRPEHIEVHDDSGTVEFHFLGKDSVEWHRTVPLPDMVRANLRELMEAARPSRGAQASSARALPQLFPDVSSGTVNHYLSRLVPGLSAKVFRTHHATLSVRRSLDESGVRKKDPEYVKWRAASLANIGAAQLCNHNKKETGDWQAAEQRHQERRGRAAERLKGAQAAVRAARATVADLQPPPTPADGEERPEAVRRSSASVRHRLQAAQARLRVARDRQQRARDALGKVDAQHEIAAQKRSWNLGTSLKSYIDPRVYHAWGQRVDYDVLERYYPTTLRRKYLWVHARDERVAQSADERVSVRACLQSDLGAVVALFGAVMDEYPELDLPLTTSEVASRYLPQLGGDWKEAAIALDDQQAVVAFAVLGPEWTDGGDGLVDVLAISHPLSSPDGLPRLVAEYLKRVLASYVALTPRRALQLRPRDGAWLAAMPDLADALGLAPEELDGAPTTTALDAGT